MGLPASDPSQLLSFYNVSALHMPSPSNLQRNLLHPNFSDEKIEIQRG